MLNNQGLSNCLTEQLIRRLFVPVFLSSLIRKDKFIIKVRLFVMILPSKSQMFDKDFKF